MNELPPPVPPGLPTPAGNPVLSSEAVRTRAEQMLEIGLRDGLAHFTIDLNRMDRVADAVLAVTRRSYPALNIPHLHIVIVTERGDGNAAFTIFRVENPIYLI